MKTTWISLVAALLLLPESGVSGDNLGRLDSVYRQLVRRDTQMFPPEEWSVTDLRVIREILYQVRNSDRIPESASAALPLTAEQVEVVCQKRLFDEEIERLHLCFESPAGRDTVAIQDFVLIRGVLGHHLYEMVKDFRGTGKDDFEKDLARVSDLYLNPLRPSIQLWSTQPRSASSFYALSIFGRLGNDALDLPFWYRGTMIGGVAVTHIDRPSAVRDPEYALYKIRAGVEQPINFSVPQSGTPSPNSVFRNRRLEGSGTAVFLNGSYAPWTDVPFLGIDTAGFIRLSLELSVATEEKEHFSPRLPQTFYSIRNYAAFLAEVRNLGIFNLGAGLAWHDLYHYSRIELPDNRPSLLEPSVNNVLASLELGIGETGGLLQYDIKTAVHFSVTDGYGFLLVKPVVMISNVFGIEVSYFMALRSSKLPPWHYDKYFVFTPVVRINF